MQVQRIQNSNYKPNFSAGTVKLKRIEPDNLLSYEAIEKLAKDCNIDISIIKSDNSKYLPKHDLFNILAKDLSGKSEMPKYGFKCLLVNKTASLEELSSKLYGKVIESIVRLAEVIKESTGKLPDFIKIVK